MEIEESVVGWRTVSQVLVKQEVVRCDLCEL